MLFFLRSPFLSLYFFANVASISESRWPDTELAIEFGKLYDVWKFCELPEKIKLLINSNSKLQKLIWYSSYYFVFLAKLKFCHSLLYLVKKKGISNFNKVTTNVDFSSQLANICAQDYLNLNFLNFCYAGGFQISILAPQKMVYLGKFFQFSSISI